MKARTEDSKQNPEWVLYIIRLGMIALAYFLAAKIGLWFVLHPEEIAGIWPASGVALAALLINKKKDRPAILAVIFLINTLSNLTSGNSLPISLGFALVNTLEPALGSWVFSRIQKHTITFERISDTLVLIVVAVGANGLTALLGALVPSLGFGAAYWDVWWIWFCEDGLGILVFTPLIIVFHYQGLKILKRSLKSWLEAVILFLLLGLWTGFIFGAKNIEAHLVLRPYMLFPLLIWAALRFKMPGAATANLIMCITAILCTVFNLGTFPLGGETPAVRLVLVQLFLSIISLTTLLQAAIFVSLQKTERELRQSEKELKKAQQTAHLGSWSWDIQNNQLHWSDEMHHIFGIDRQNFSGKFEDVIQRAVHPNDRPKIEAANLSVVEKNTPISLEYRVIWPDGSEHVIWDETGEIILDTAGKVKIITGIAQDITERKRAEAALLDSETRYRLLVENSTDLVCEIDMAGCFTYLSPQYEAVLGYTPQELMGTAVSELGYQEDMQIAQPKYESLLSEKAPTRDIWRFRHKNGEWRWIECSGAVYEKTPGDIRAVVVSRDITERKQAEDELRAYVLQQIAETEIGRYALSNLDTSQLLEKIVLTTARVLKVEMCKILELLPTKENFLLRAGVGWKPGLVGKVLINTDPDTQAGYTLLHSEPIIVTDLARETRFSGPPLLFEHRVVSGISVVIGDIQKPYGVLGAHTTHTRQFNQHEINFLQSIANIIAMAVSRRQSEEQIRQMNIELEQRVQERTAQLSTANQELESFSYSVSHDLRAPLRNINGFTQIIQNDYSPKLDDKARSYLQQIYLSALRMENLIDNLLKLARVTRNEITLEAVDLAGVARGIITELQNSQPERQVIISLPDNLPVQADSNLIHIVMDNLLRNAWKYTRKTPEAKIELGSFYQENQLIIFVHDNGAGFDMAQVDKLFTPFQRLHPEKEFEGNGIGLAMVQRIIRHHGGSIWAKGAVNQGATFYFTLD
jgi:PAS domain S-box-containing protein